MTKWSKKVLKQELNALYQAPEPEKKAAFIRSLSPKTDYISMARFMWEQTGYIRPVTWLMSAGILIIAILGSRFLTHETVWLLSSAVPFLALTVLTENSKSVAFHMEELELATRFSLKSVLLARMGILAVIHSAVLLVLCLCLKSTLLPVMGHIPCILVPYFLTVCSGIYLFRTCRVRKAPYLPFAAPALVSMLMLCLRQLFPVLYNGQRTGFWLLALAVLILFTVREASLCYRQSEVFI